MYVLGPNTFYPICTSKLALHRKCRFDKMSKVCVYFLLVIRYI